MGEDLLYSPGVPDFFELPWAVEPTSLSLPFLSVVQAIFSTSLLVTARAKRQSSAIPRAGFVSPGPLNTPCQEGDGWLRWDTAHGDAATTTGAERAAYGVGHCWLC